MKKLFTIITITTLLLVACQSDIERNEEVKERLSYFKDDRTGLCFAQISSMSYAGYYTVSIAAVPCDSVNHLLLK